MHKNEYMQLHSEVLKAGGNFDDLSGDGRIKLVSISRGWGQDWIACNERGYIVRDKVI